MSEEVDLIREARAAGIIFHPKSGKLRPELTDGPVNDDLRRRVETKKEALLLFFVAAFDWSDFESGDDTTLEANFSRGEHYTGVDCHVVSVNGVPPVKGTPNLSSSSSS
jgi:hypothetical protein